MVELLVVIAIIAILIGLLMPSLARARSAAKTTQCSANLHQLSNAFANYAADWSGKFPPNVSLPSPGNYWYDDDRIAHYIPSRHPPVPAGKPGGGVFACPEDPEPAWLGYSMNVWASSAVDSSVAPLGTLWLPAQGHSSQIILLAESYSQSGSASTGWYSPATIGAAGTTAAMKFGGGGGISPPLNAKRWGYVTSELDFMRHRGAGTPGSYTQAKGRLNIAFADGHVSTVSDADLVTASANPTGLAHWTSTDWGGN